MIQPRLLVLARELPDYQSNLRDSLSLLLGFRVSGVAIEGSAAIHPSIENLLGWAVLGLEPKDRDCSLDKVQRGCELYVGIRTPRTMYANENSPDGEFNTQQLGERGFDLAQRNNIPAILLDTYDQRTICDFVQNQGVLKMVDDTLNGSLAETKKLIDQMYQKMVTPAGMKEVVAGTIWGDGSAKCRGCATVVNYVISDPTVSVDTVEVRRARGDGSLKSYPGFRFTMACPSGDGSINLGEFYRSIGLRTGNYGDRITKGSQSYISDLVSAYQELGKENTRQRKEFGSGFLIQ